MSRTFDDEAIYLVKPYVLMNKDGVVLAAGSKAEMDADQATSYYKDCTVSIRKHDLHLNDNTKIVH